MIRALDQANCSPRAARACPPRSPSVRRRHHAQRGGDLDVGRAIHALEKEPPAIRRRLVINVLIELEEEVLGGVPPQREGAVDERDVLAGDGGEAVRITVDLTTERRGELVREGI